MSEVRVIPRTVSEAGGCNGCARADENGHYPYRKVMEISLRGCSVRVCHDCGDKLMKGLKWAHLR